jgi:predicted nucleotidyltransferase
MKPKRTLLDLFYNYPSKQWHFEQLRRDSNFSRAQTNEWIKKLVNDHLIVRIKPKGNMPYYQANCLHPHYQNSKRLYALQGLHDSGLLDYLSSLEKAEVIVIFGSFSRWDWYDKSDIDIFIYGNIGHLSLGKYTSSLKREIQIFSGTGNDDLRQMGPALLRNILRGIVIKGNFPQEVISHAAV